MMHRSDDDGADGEIIEEDGLEEENSSSEISEPSYGLIAFVVVIIFTLGYIIGQ